MTGPEHYARAEQLLLQSEHAYGDSREGETYPRARWLVDAAQVHATLALAAATCDHSDRYPNQWNKVISP